MADPYRLKKSSVPRRWRGKQAIIPEIVSTELKRRCPNWNHLAKELFNVLESIPKASSAVECINSRVGFFRYTKKRFNDDFSNLISVTHNLTPFLDGKRKGKSPAEIEKSKITDNGYFWAF